VYSVDIDVGGTLTDGIFSDGQRSVCAKVDTTAHDLTICLFDCLTQGSNQLGFSDLSSFLEQVELLRWSTTITSNVLAELRGPKIGLIVSQGNEQDLYGKAAVSPIVNHIVAQNNIIGLENPDGVEILNAVRSLLAAGVRRICISLRGALENSQPEQHIKQIIEQQYPDHFLGSVPVLAGSEICQNSDDMTRTYCAVINAYTHSALATTLFKAEDELRYNYGFSRAFLISHINGGVAGVSKTKAIDTMESGPIAGLYGAGHWAKTYGLERVIALDVGGTTAKVGILHAGEPVYSEVSDLFGIPLRIRLPYLRSIALGGGSVVSLQGKRVCLGPESMGSFPGPICYGLGGDKPTLTDAFLTAGLIDPEYFLGGAKTLDLAAAREAIEALVAAPQGTSLAEGCRAILDRAYDMVGSMLATASRELERDLSDHVLFAYGGNGGLVAAGVAQRAALDELYLFSLGPVFSAFGSSVSDISHVYERSLLVTFHDGSDVAALNQAIEEMWETGIRDLLGEGIKAEGAECAVELEVSQGHRAKVTRRFLRQRFANVDDLRQALGADRDHRVEVVRVRLKKAISKPTARPRALGPQKPAAALVGKRPVSEGSTTGEARIYRWEFLGPGNQVEGCSILESENSTYFVPDGWSAEIDGYGNLRLRRTPGHKNRGSTHRQEAQSYGGRPR
jgi:N-methylhydantoinase A